ncbi:cytochrome P450 9e2-like [Euwallacea similis]|uniref:cytochrome P450 9e2-like n=1 Tax=Euwallacea similis TaxID=1736056 RepID=UPI00344EA54C
MPIQTNDDITAQAVLFFFAGFDAISTTICFAFYKLTVKKDVQAKLREDVFEAHEANNIKLMKRLSAVVASLYTMKLISLDEFFVPLKSRDHLLFSPISLYMVPAYYPDPTNFDPERFSEQNRDSINLYANISFGAGTRNCICP